MDKVQINFDFLSRETIALSEEMVRLRLVEEAKANLPEIEEYPEEAGVIYYPEFGGSTFCVRGLCCENIKESFELIKNKNTECIKKLKLNRGSSPELFYFRTPNLELAEIIYSQMINKRMLFQEEIVCNISDPGFSWWMDIREDGFKVFFKSYGLKKTENFVKLGPIGDRAIVSKRFKQILPYLDQFIDFNEFSIDESSLSIEVKDSTNTAFQKLKELFMFGTAEDLFHSLPQNDFGQTLYYYFLELETLRSFWLLIEEKLALEQISKAR